MAVSTTPIKVIYGDSSAGGLTSAQICHQPGVNPIVVDGILGIEGGYIALESTIAHADGGLTLLMYGD